MPSTAARSESVTESMIEWGLQPLFLVGAFLLWVALGGGETMSMVVLACAHALLAVFERYYPAHPQWKQTGSEKAVIVGITVVDLILFGLVLALYQLTAEPSLARLREAAGLNIWPGGWPPVFQVALIFFASELMTYWIHRSLHRSEFLWRASGHAFHHSFKNLHAINFLTAHPFELFFLAVPTFLMGALFGADPQAMAVTSMLQMINSSIVHSNVRINSIGIGLVLATPAAHRRHHSSVFSESNSNYSCNAIFWDRVFGTYSEGAVKETGIGPEEPGLMDKLLLPIRQPSTISVAPGNAKSS